MSNCSTPCTGTWLYSSSRDTARHLDRTYAASPPLFRLDIPGSAAASRIHLRKQVRMRAPMVPANEGLRLEALRGYSVLDTLPEQALDDLTMLAAEICGTPTALISLVDERRQWFKSRLGWTASETPRDISFCGHAILQSDLFIVPDTCLDPRFADNPMVTGSEAVRFYAGAPLITPEGQTLGTLCILDRVPHVLTAAQQAALKALGRQVMAQLELRRQSRELAGSEERYRTLVDRTPEAIVVHQDGMVLFVNPAAVALFRAHSAEALVGRSIYSFVKPAFQPMVRARMESVGVRGYVTQAEEELLRFDGTTMEVAAQSTLIPYLGGHAIYTSIWDITARKRAAIDSNRLAAIVADSDDAILTTDLFGVITSWNQSAERSLGYRAADIIGESITRLIPADRRAEDNLVLVQVRLGASVQPFESQRLTKAGRLIDVSVTVSPIRDSSRTVIGMSKVFRDITQRKLAESARLASEARYRALFDYAPDGIIIADAESRYIDANASICRMLGYSHDELVGMYARDTVLPAEVEHIAPALQAIKLGPEYHREWQFRHKDGSAVSAEVMVTTMPDGNLLAMIRDVTGRKHDELRIQHLNRVYAVLSDINENIVREHDPRAMLTSACRIAVEKGRFLMAWIGVVDVAGDRIEIAAHAGASSDTLALTQRFLDGGHEHHGLSTDARRTGQHAICNDVAADPSALSWREPALERGYRAVASLPLKSGGKVVGLFNLYDGEPGFFGHAEMRLLDELAKDIAFALEVYEREAARRQVEQALTESESRFRQLAANIQEVFWMTDPATNRTLYVSPAYEKIWGRSCDSLYGTPHAWLAAVHPDDRDRVVAAEDGRMGTGDYDETYRIVRPDGSERWIRDRASPVKDAAGQLLRIVGTAEDVTERRQLEEELRQSQKMEAIGQLAGGVAHDFNNILTVIQGFGSLLMAGGQTKAESAEAAEQIVLASERAAGLTRQLLAFSRRQVMQTRLLDLNGVVTGLATMLRRILGEDITLKLRLDAAPVMAQADAGMIDQVILNLVVNARDAMPAGGEISVNTEACDLSESAARLIPGAHAGHYACLYVSDGGTGISAENLQRIFEPFFTTKDPGKGTGLGLATVFGIVTQHSGYLQVESLVGRGTTFRIFLPAVALPMGAPIVDPVRAKPQGGSETILVVEDEASVRRLTRAVLERGGYQILEAGDGKEALRLWRQHRAVIQLVLTDLVMPGGVSGIELAARLSAERSDIKVIFTSGYSAEVAGRDLQVEGGRSFIQKPFSPDQLLEMVRRELDG